VTDFSAPVAQALQGASAEARQQNSPIVGTPHLFIALTKLDGDTAAALRGQGHDPKRIRDGSSMVLPVWMQSSTSWARASSRFR